MRHHHAFVLLALLAACGRTADRDDTIAIAETTAMPAMPGMPGMGTMMSGAMMDSITAHMRAMDSASASGMQAMLPGHRQMAANMIAQMNREMREMNMTGDARWTALLDSVRQDLVRMPDLSAGQLKVLMPAHQARLARLMQAHRAMMNGGKM